MRTFVEVTLESLSDAPSEKLPEVLLGIPVSAPQGIYSGVPLGIPLTVSQGIHLDSHEVTQEIPLEVLSGVSLEASMNSLEISPGISNLGVLLGIPL